MSFVPSTRKGRLMRTLRPCLLAIAFLLSARPDLAAEGLNRIGTKVTYVSGTTIYLGCGRGGGLAVGDTATIMGAAGIKTAAILTAVSVSSASSRPLDLTAAVVIGDSAVIVKLIAETPAAQSPARTMASPAAGIRGSGPQVHGRFATQLAGAYSDGPGWTLLQPSVLMRLDVGGVLGEDLSFTMFGRTYRDFSQASSGPGYSGETMVRMYDMSIRYGASGGWLGMGLGRLVSYYVGGLGAFDGGEMTVRMGVISAGLIGGGQPDYRTSSVDPDRRKFAAYVNWRLGTDELARNDLTLAYGRQYFRGTLDRDFLYLQASLTPAPGLYLYQSAEIDLHELEGGESLAKTHLTSTFLTLSWMPTTWLSASAGYDATRPIIYLESMKTFPDTLLRRDLQQGVRLSGHVRLPARVTLSVNTGLRMKTGDAREAVSYGGGIRVANIAAMGLAAGIQYRRARALYSEGDDITLNLEQWIARRMTVALTYNRYAYTLVGQEIGAVATTLSAAFSLRLISSWYVMANLDKIWDPGRDSYRMLAELGFHF